MNISESNDETLLAALQSPAYTPPYRLLGALFCLCISPNLDSKNRQNITRGLLRLGEVAWEYGVAFFPTVSKESRIPLLRMLGYLADRKPDPKKTGFFLHYAKDSDAKTCRAAIIELGKFKDRALEASLLGLWNHPYAVPERKVLIEALGNVGGRATLEILRTFLPPKDDAECRRVLSRACLYLERQIVREQGSGQIRGDRQIPEGISLILRCRTGIEKLLCAELLKLHPTWNAQIRNQGRIEVFGVDTLAQLFRSRLFMDCAFSQSLVIDTSLPQSIIEALIKPQIGNLLLALTEGPIRYRIHFSSGRHSKTLIWHIAEQILGHNPAFVNDPQHSLWEVQVDDLSPQPYLDIVPKQFPDSRFSYRLDHIPASSHPTVAAALAFIAEVKPEDVIWDPFVGSGSELIEASLKGPCKHLMGSDIDPKALSIAKKNLAQASVSAELILVDACQYRPSAVSLILTNPPMGRRVQRGRMKELLAAFLIHAYRVLQPNGRLVWISPLPVVHRQQAMELGFRLKAAQVLDMNGFEAEIQVWTKSNG